MTEQDYSKDVLAAPTGNLLVGNADAPPPSISFNTRDAGEIAKFTEEGFYYKGEFVDDAGEVHRLMKATLKDLLVVRNMPTDDDLDELALFWWGPDTDERTVSEVIEEGSMSAFARYVLTSYAHKNQ